MIKKSYRPLDLGSVNVTMATFCYTNFTVKTCGNVCWWTRESTVYLGSNTAEEPEQWICDSVPSLTQQANVWKYVFVV